MSAILIENLSKHFVIPSERRATLKESLLSLHRPRNTRILKAIDDISFSVSPGESLGIIGANGSGKSTLLKILAGVYAPSKGDIKVKGRVSPLLELGIGFNDELSARDNITLNATILGLKRAEIAAIYPEIVSFSGLHDFMEMKVRNFSTGMRLRLAFSIAAHVEADIYLCDEVLAVGDAEFQKQCMSIFHSLKANGKTIILVTHDLSTAASFCNRLILLEKGKIASSGEPQEVILEYQREREANTF